MTTAYSREGPLFNGYIIDDDLVGVLNIGQGARMFYLAATFVGVAVVDYDGYWDGEALLARLQVIGDSPTTRSRQIWRLGRAACARCHVGQGFY